MGWKWQLAQKLEIRWWQQYLRNKEVDAYLSAKKAYWHRVLREIDVSIPKHAKVLDAGCGPAGIFMALPYCKVWATDPLMDHYQQKIPHFQTVDYPWTTFQNETLEDLNKVAEFDIIFCLNVINHVNDIKRAMDALVQAAKPGATFVLSIDAHRYPWLKTIFQTLPGDVLHPHQYALEDYRVMLEKRHCQIVQSLCLKPGRIFDYWILVARCPGD
ncbi:MAG: hypothetical protein Sapg2KO_20450 [Saprospiraceae bacterium]